MAKLNYVKYQNKSKNEKLRNKWYARVKHRETLSLRQLAQHIAEHGSVYTEDVVVGVLTKMRQCIVELCLDSKKVKLDGLGTFYITAKTTGAQSADEFTVRNIKSLHLRFAPEQAGDTSLNGTALMTRASLAEDNEYQVGAKTSTSSSSSSGSQGGSDSSEPGVEKP